MNYLNKFGQAAKSYMTYDNVSELYYAAVRYFENLDNVPEWTNSVAQRGAAGKPSSTVFPQ
jgi:type IV pilus assembly protein PilY1